MTGSVTGGQKLTPNPNVEALSGIYGDMWGANGGGSTPIGGGVSGQTGWDERVAPAQGRAQTAANYEQSPIPPTSVGAATSCVLSKQSNTALVGTALDDALAAGGSNQG